MDWVVNSFAAVFDVNEVFSPIYILAWAAIAWLIYMWRREHGGFFAWLFPAQLWRHKSTAADFWLFLIGRAMAVLGIAARFGVAPLVAAWVAGLIGRDADAAEQIGPLALALLVWVVVDFANYWSHRIFHTAAVIWPLHAVHHSAEVLTPLTTFRQHPLGTIVNAAISTFILGAVLGVMVGVISPSTPMAQIIGANAFVVLANLTVANFHHSHIWISFGPVMERVFISPAQHHIHHSTKPAHFNRNYGQFLALWDWMFGTLYIVRDREDLTFGLGGESDAPLMSHRLGPLLLDPLRRMLPPPR